LVVLVPEAESLVGSFRERYDPAAAAGMPAHITTLYPFKPPAEIDGGIMNKLTSIIGASQPFDYAIGENRRFPGVLYLAPQQSEPFRQLTNSLWQAFPETPPYGGQYSEIVPHLTVAFLADEKLLDVVEKELLRTVAEKLPIRGKATEVALMDNESGRWRVRAKLSLGR
jgi:2'-5' RNA ligase